MKKRFRDYELITGSLPTGELNLLSDIAGIQVGHFTVSEGMSTGITVVSPSAENAFRHPLAAAAYVGNGYGKSTGISQIQEMGTIETPIALTSTLSVGPVMQGIIDLVIGQTPDILPYESINAVVGETNDWILNDIHGKTLKPEDVTRAWDNRTTTFELGAVGAGAGTRAFSWKGGIGSASRQVTLEGKTYTVGTLVQTNYGGELTMLGVPVGRLLKADPSYSFMGPQPDGSCMILTATDAPLTDRQLGRLAKRSLIGLARTGSIMATSSGDFVFAWSTAHPNDTSTGPTDNDLNVFFQAAVEATEESVYDALFCAATTKGRDGNYLEALPTVKVARLLHNRLSSS